MATVSDIIDFVRLHASGDARESDTNIIKAAIARALGNLSREFDWSFFRVSENFNTKAPYETGSVAVNHEGTAVTGTGSAWTTAAIAAGDLIEFNGEGRFYVVSAVGGQTSITLSTAYLNDDGDNLSGATYSIYRRDFAPASYSVAKVVTIENRRDGTEMIQVSQGVMQSLWNQGRWQSCPERFSIEYVSSAQKLRLWPIPDDAYPMTMVYQREPAAVPADISQTVDWLRYDELLKAASFVAYSDGPGGAKYRQAARQMRAEAWSAAMRQENANMPIAGVGTGVSFKRKHGIMRYSHTTNWT